MSITTSAPSLIKTLPGRFYTEQSIFDLGMKRIYSQRWICIARGEDLPNSGSFVTATVGGESVIALRGRDGQLRAFFNVCRHRGARLCVEKTGSVGKSLQCMYHAWTYGLDGKLIAAPNLASMEDVDRSEYGLSKVSLREWLGYVWVNLADEPGDFETEIIQPVNERLGDTETLARYGIDGLRVGKRIEYEVEANWKIVVENFMECYHCSTIHPELVDALPSFVEGIAPQSVSGGHASYADEVEAFTLSGTGGFPRLPGLTDEDDRRYFGFNVWPQVFMNLVSDHVIAHYMTPIGPARSKVVCEWLYTPETAAKSDEELADSYLLFDRVNAQDFEACERCQMGVSSRTYDHGGVFVPNEHHIARFHEFIRGSLGLMD
jgi:glycine betaine catabolism A